MRCGRTTHAQVSAAALPSPSCRRRRRCCYRRQRASIIALPSPPLFSSLLSQAERLYRSVVAGGIRALGATHDDTLLAVRSLAECLLLVGKTDEAVRVSRTALTRCEAEDAGHERTMKAVTNLALILMDGAEQRRLRTVRLATALAGREGQCGDVREGPAQAVEGGRLQTAELILRP